MKPGLMASNSRAPGFANWKQRNLMEMPIANIIIIIRRETTVNVTKQNKTKQNKTKQNKTKQNKTKMKWNNKNSKKKKRKIGARRRRRRRSSSRVDSSITGRVNGWSSDWRSACFHSYSFLLVGFVWFCSCCCVPLSSGKTSFYLFLINIITSFYLYISGTKQ